MDLDDSDNKEEIVSVASDSGLITQDQENNYKVPLPRASHASLAAEPTTKLPYLNTTSTIDILQLYNYIDLPYLYNAQVSCDLMHVPVMNPGRPRCDYQLTTNPPTTVMMDAGLPNPKKMIEKNTLERYEIPSQALPLNRKPKRRRTMDNEQLEQQQEQQHLQQPQNLQALSLPPTLSISSSSSSTIPNTVEPIPHTTSSTPQTLVIYAKYTLERTIKPPPTHDFPTLSLIKDRRPETKAWKKLVRHRILYRRDGTVTKHLNDDSVNQIQKTFSRVCNIGRPGPKPGAGFGARNIRRNGGDVFDDTDDESKFY
ncbi:UNVERIFIED_CONTAM: hypothetical protein HDU68_006486 [Siphonaria sp. JEL0065]|nr:hypothetical protein HDU68_006486 [Siphonaria sp. JEL0065]